MIRQPTLFIIGAGASKEFNFPLGGDLLDKLADLFNVERDTIGRWVGSSEFVNLARVYEREFGTDHNQILEKARFVRSKILGVPKSIDQLIDTYSGDLLFEKVAKLGIAREIARSEATYLPPLQPHWKIGDQPWVRNNWLEIFSRNYFAGFRKNDLHLLFEDVFFISFNYDRCLEYGLLRAAAHHFDLTDEQALALPARLRVIHPYGSLGNLPQSRADLNAMFENVQRESNVVTMAGNIKTFTESADQDKIRDKISKFFELSEKVVCLGFGYNSMNVGLLMNPDPRRHKVIYGTTFGLSQPNTNAASELISRQVNGSGNLGHRFANLKAESFLTDYELELFR